MIESKARNLLIGSGAYSLSWLIEAPLGSAYGKLTQHVVYHGTFASTALSPFVTHVPVALVAAGVGACVAWLVETSRPLLWVLFPALLYLLEYFSYTWIQPPMPLDRVAQVIGALFPAVTCILGGVAVARRRVTPSISSAVL
jgi:hypothetical protein